MSRARRRFRAMVALGYVVVILVTVGGAALGIHGLSRAAATTEGLVRERAEDQLAAERVRSAAEGMVAATRGYLVSGSQHFLVRLRAAEANVDDGVKALRARVQSTEGVDLLQATEEAAADYRLASERVVADRPERADQAVLSRLLEDVLQPRRQAFDRALSRLSAHEERKARAGETMARRQMARALEVTVGSLALGILLGALLAWRSTRRLSAMYGRETEALSRAQHAVAARNQLLAIVAHDLGNPLGVIVMKSSYLSARPDEETSRHARSIENIARRMNHLVRALLDTASLEEGRLSISCQPCAAADLLDETVELFEGMGASRSISVSSQIEDRSVLVIADRDRLLQVLANLGANAVRVSAPGGEIRLSTTRQGEELRFSVADRGPGIAAEALPHIFDRFWKSKSQGAGLGLFIAKAIIEAHGGRIWVESAPGDGATFHFTLAIHEV